jgi:hypothetical protein
VIGIGLLLTILGPYILEEFRLTVQPQNLTSMVDEFVFPLPIFWPVASDTVFPLISNLLSFVCNALVLTPTGTSLCLILLVACLVLDFAARTPMLGRYAAHIHS